MTNKIVRADGTTQISNIKSCVYTESVNASTDLRPGCVSSACINVSVYGSQDSAPSSGEALTYYQVDSEGTETLIGTFYAEPAITTRDTYTFTAYDSAAKLDVDFSETLKSIQSSFPMTVYQIVQRACSVAGVRLASTSWPLSTQSVQAFPGDGISCRDIVSWAAEIGCRFVRCNTSGALVFGWYETSSNSIAPSTGTNQIAYKQDGLHYENYSVSAVSSVAIRPVGSEGAAYIYPSSASGGNQLTISNNLLLMSASSTVMNAVAQNIYTVMRALPTWRPSQISVFSFENEFRAGDIVSVTDSQGVTFNTLVMKFSISTSGATLSSSGNETYSDYESGSNKALANLSANIIKFTGDVVFESDLVDGTTVISGDNILTGTISADRIDASSLVVDAANITGTISVGALPDTLVTGTSSKTQYYLSTSSSSATGGTWQDTVPTWSSGKYVWTRTATTNTYSDESTETTYSAAVYDPNLTTAISDAASASSAVGGANYREQIIYRSASSATTSVSAYTTWVTSTSNTQNAWTTRRPTYSSSYPVLFVATQRQTVAQSSGTTCSCTTPVIDQTTTVIDGGHITTGTIDASVVNVANLNASNIVSGTITGISINNGSGTFTVDNSGNLTATSATITGTVTSSNLTATGGTIGGFTIGSTALYNNRSSITPSSGSTQGVYLGTDGISLGTGSTNYFKATPSLVLARNLKAIQSVELYSSESATEASGYLYARTSAYVGIGVGASSSSFGDYGSMVIGSENSWWETLRTDIRTVSNVITIGVTPSVNTTTKNQIIEINNSGVEIGTSSTNYTLKLNGQSITGGTTYTFDTTPTSGSTNPVTSGGIYTAVQTAKSGWYGTCGTAAATQAKVVTISGITALSTGLSIRVKFTYAQTYNGTPTLNLNSLGAKNICYAGASGAGQYEWAAGDVLDLVYDGTRWIIEGGVHSSLLTLGGANGRLVATAHTVCSGQTISAGSYANGTTTFTKTGYYPLGIVGWTSGSTYAIPVVLNITTQASGSATVTWYIRNANTSSDISSLTMNCKILWYKTS